MNSPRENIILFDDDNWQGLLPLTFTRPVSELRVGILTIRQKWEHDLNGIGSFITQDYLVEKYPIRISADNIIINSTFLPTKKLVHLIKNLQPKESLLAGDELIAARLPRAYFERLKENTKQEELRGFKIDDSEDAIRRILRPYHIFKSNGSEIVKDLDRISMGEYHQSFEREIKCTGSFPIYIHPTSKVGFCYLNSSKGPIHIGPHSEIMEGAMIRGPFSLGEGSIVKMGTKIYGDTTIGPYCKVGGEVTNCVIQGFSNKSHDGYLGNSVIGQWCNLGADTNVSNLKNNYDSIKIWSYPEESFKNTGLQFCGLVMGDHSKTAINTMINTGTVIGVGCNVFGPGFPRNFIPSFSWGGASGLKTHDFSKFLKTASLVMERRGKLLTSSDEKIFHYIFENTSKFRRH